MQPSPETTLVIILGASEYPKLPRLSNEAFRNSVDGFQRYLLNRNGFALTDDNLLNLFDSAEGPDAQNERIGSFLAARIKELDQSKVKATDLILYYVGHGTFVDPGNRYILALKNIKEGSEDLSGFPMKALANTIKENAPQLRRYVILDCCFSAAAFESFQNVGPLELARQKTQEYLPSKGTALLCASGARDAAKAPHGAKYTMFSSVLLDILENGSTDLPERFSLSDLALKTQDAIQERYTDEGVRPQVLSPDQSVGDIARLAIFPNPGLGVRFLSENLDQLRRTVTDLVGVREKLEQGQASLAARLDDLAKVIKEAARVRPAVAEIEIPEPTMQDDSPRSQTTGLTEREWNALPGRIKSEIHEFRKRNRNGRVWLISCCLLAALTWGFALGHLLLAATYWRVIGDVLITLCGLIVILQSGILTRLSQGWASPATTIVYSSEAPGPWEDYEIVVQAAKQKWRSVFGLEIERTAQSISQLICLVTFAGTILMRVYLAFVIYR